MNVKVPKGLNSPTVIIVGQGNSRGENNDKYSKRMDTLEKKLDQQYERFYKRDSIPIVNYSPLLKSFSSKVGSLEKTIKKLANKIGEDSNDELISAFEKILSKIERNKGDIIRSPADYSKFISKISSLEKAIGGLSKQKLSVNTGSLNNSFNKLFERLEAAIMKARPRMIPYVS